MRYKTLRLPEQTWGSHNPLSTKAAYEAFLVVMGDTIVKNHTEFTDKEIRLITNNLVNLELINNASKETAYEIEKQINANKYLYLLIR